MGNVRITSGLVRNLFGAAVTSPTIGGAIYKDSPYASFQASVVGTGTVTATVIIECSNNGVHWCSTPMGTISLSGTTSSSDGFTTEAPWKFVRARVTAISGTNATITALIGV
ncbi:MAG: hypothetical protein DDT42_01296 [candidate division WS2 bacterium]|uniref:Uncharacterized protein n=1 Tax=Psychracetigena formicireducens TaxID=2986056 RepID=A0A9E2F6K1_PSYF1|nr:hypothetical protein [Candidatus Psychracetigena formicireducens]